MADNKLGQALEEIIRDQRTTKRVTDRRAPSGAPKAPSGGIQKSQPRQPRRVQPARAATFKPDTSGRPERQESKVLVSNLPYDVTETMIKEYFSETVGHIRRVEVEYNRDGSSKGKAEILFGTLKGADICFEKLNGLPIDNRPIKVEIIGAQPNRDAPKSLSERAGQPKKEKVQPKSAADNKKDQQQKNTRAGNQQNKNGVQKPQAQNTKQAARPRNARPAKKTLEELDLEMADYFEGAPGDAPAAGNQDAPAPAAAGGDDAAMDDEIS